VSGGTVNRTFTIQNTGTVALTVGTVTAGGDFAVTTQPVASIAAGSSGTFVVTFDPSASGVRTASVSFSNGDADENPYNFSIQGAGNASLPAPWVEADVGSPTPAGSASFNGTTWTVTGAGLEVYNKTDQFHYVPQLFTGDCTITARVATEQNTNQWAKVGIMFRETLAPDSAYSFLFITPDQSPVGTATAADRGVLFEYRATTGNNADAQQTSAEAALIPPHWLRIVRTGNTFTASRSSDGTTWNLIGSQSITLPSQIWVGLAVCSHTDGTLNTSTFDHVTVSAGGGNYSPSFPRLGIYAIGGSGSLGQAYGTETQWMMSKHHLVVIAGSYEGWASNRGYSREQVVTSIKNQSAVGTKVFQYVILESVAQPIQLPTWDIRAGQNNWYLLDQTTGNRVQTDYPAYQINMTQFAPNDPGPGSLRPFAWGAQLVYDLFVDPTGSYGPPELAAPSLDGMYLDNVFPYAKATGDWDRDNVANDPDDFGFAEFDNYGINAATWWRAGQLDYFTKIRQLMPGKLQMGNSAEFYNVARPEMTDLGKIGVLNQLLNGGILEPAVGAPSAPETWGAPDYTGTILKAYRYTMDALAAPKLCIFESRVAMNGSDPVDATPYRAARYGLAICLMNDGYWDPNNTQSPNTHLVDDTRWFDEMSVLNGVGQKLRNPDLSLNSNVNAGLGYLGQPLESPRTAARWTAKGVWAREFTGGLVILNPRGNGPRDITLAELGGSIWKRIQGTQAPSINTGLDVTGNISLADRDAIILLRK
jgi:hypothetical protein